MANVNVKATMNSSAYQQQMRQMVQQMKDLNSSYSLTKTSAQLYGRATDVLKQQQAELSEKIKLQNGIVKTNEDQYKKLATQLNETKSKQQQLRENIENTKAKLEESAKSTGENSNETKKLKEELKKLESEYSKNEKTIGKSETALSKHKAKTDSSKEALLKMGDSLKKVNEQLNPGKLEKFSKVCDTVATKSKKIGDSTSKIAASIAVVSAASLKSYSEVKEGTDNLTAATGATGEALDKLKESYRNVVNQSGSSMGDIGAVMGEVNTRLDITGEQLENYTMQTLKFAKVNKTDGVSSVKLVTRAMGDASIPTKDYYKIMDALTVAAQKSGISIDTLATNLAKYGAPMRALGFTTQESIAMFAGWEKAGVSTEIAFSGMKKAISNWSSQGKDSRIEFKKTLDEISKCPDIASATTKAIKVFGQKAGPDLADAIKGGRFEFAELEKAISKSEGTVTKTSAAMRDSNADIKIAMNQAKLAASDLGSEFLKASVPAVKAITGSIKDLCNWFSSLDDETKQNIAKVALLTAAIVPATYAVGKLSKGVKTTIDVYKNVSEVIKKAAVALGLKKTVTATSAATETVATVATVTNTAAQGANAAAVGTATIATKALGIAQKALPLLAITGLIIGAIAAVAAFASSIDNEANRHRKNMEAMDEEIEARKKAREEQVKQLESNLAEIQNVQSLNTELKGIVSSNGKIKKGYEERVTFITGQLNEALGTEMTINNGVLKGYKDLAGSIDTMIAKRRAEIILESQLPAYKKALTESVNAQTKANKLNAEYVELNTKKMKIEAELAAAYGESWSTNVQMYQSTLGQEYMSLMTITENKKVEYEKQSGIAKGYYDDIANYEKNASRIASGNAKEMNKIESSIVADKAKSNEEKKKLLQDSKKAEEEHLKYLQEKYKGTNDKIELQQIESQKKKIKNVEDEIKGMTETVDKKKPAVTNSWELLMLNVTSSIYAKNKDFKKAGASNAQATADGANGKKEANEKAGTTIGKAALTGIFQLKNSFQSAGAKNAESVGKGVTSKEASNKKAIKKNLKTMQTTVEDSKSDFKTAGGFIVSGINQALTDGEGTFKQKMIKICGIMLKQFAFSNEIRSPSKRYYDLTKWIPKAIVNSLNDGVPGVVKSISELSNSMYKGASNNLDDYKKIGAYAGTGFISAYTDSINTTAISERMNALKETAKTYAFGNVNDLNVNQSSIEPLNFSKTYDGDTSIMKQLFDQYDKNLNAKIDAIKVSTAIPVVYVYLDSDEITSKVEVKVNENIVKEYKRRR